MAKSKNVTQQELNRFKGVLAALVAVVLVVAGGLALVGKNFADSQVQSQLKQEKIFFPPAGSPALDPAEYPGLQQYAGQQVDNGPKAKAYADEFIYSHMQQSSEGRSYAEVSSAARENPDDKKLEGLKATLFQGSALRSMLLTAYAFSVFGTIAGYAAVGAFVVAGVLALVAVKYLGKP